MDVNDYLLDVEGTDRGKAFEPWHWRLPTSFTPWLFTQFGEALLVLEDGSVHHFDPEGGEVEPVADSKDAFAAELGDPERAAEILLAPLVDGAVAAGLTLGPGQCYGFARPTVLGGQYALDNVRVKTITEYYAFLADLHEQIRDLPDGAQIKLDLTD